ncbi:MAG TPA: AsnC family transcriptional regulator [Rhodobacteraceae bacterium]|jgi:DNA-binding Lrp family transcriptional regulator|nr:AsnC family transcriptional regulator [Paracoccaceae bacterium]
MDITDQKLIAALRQDGRASISALAATLNLTRTTVRSRMQSLQQSGEIIGFTAVLRGDAAHAPVRSQMMIAIEGRGTERVIRQLSAMPSVDALHTTNGKWDLIAELSADSLEELDGILRQIRLLEGIATSETNLLLATRKMARLR